MIFLPTILVMPSPDLRSTELHRGPLARVRTLGFLGVSSWVVLAFAVGGVMTDGPEPGRLAAIAAIVVVRAAIALEYVRCDEHGLSWRSLFFTHRVPWDRVAGIETTVVNRRLWFVRMSLPAAGMVVVMPDGAEVELQASIWCPIMCHAEFIAAARLISSHNWADVADGIVATTEPGDGHRRRRPLLRRRPNIGA